MDFLKRGQKTNFKVSRQLFMASLDNLIYNFAFGKKATSMATMLTFVYPECDNCFDLLGHGKSQFVRH